MHYSARKALAFFMMLGLLLISGISTVLAAPNAINDGYTAFIGDTLVVSAAEGVLANDTGATSATLDVDVTNGTLLFNTDGSFEYTPNINATGTDSFSYTADDGSGGTSNALVTLTLGNDPDPVPSINITATSVSHNTSGSPTPIAPDLTLSGPTNLNEVVVSISTGLIAAEDRLTINGNASGTITGISYAYNQATGNMTLSGQAAIADYQAALRLVAYSNAAGTPTNGIRNVDFAVTEGAIYYPGNAHFYEVIGTTSQIAWTQAFAIANNRTLFGLQGYLVTLTSAAEDNFVADKLSGAQGWIGGSDDPAYSTGGDKVWEWVNGPEQGTVFILQNGYVVNGPNTCDNGVLSAVTYQNFASGEPNDFAVLEGQTNGCAGNEDYAHYLSSGQWNDYPDGDLVITNYIIEYGGLAGDPQNLNIVDSVTVNVNDGSATTPPVITSNPPSGGTVNVAYNHTYTATGDTPINYIISSGFLPNGVTLSGNTLSGTPTVAGTFTGVITASNGAGTATQAFSITIAEPTPVPPTITSSPPPDGALDAAYSHTYTATGNTPITYAVTAGELPTGLTLSGDTISGTPTALGLFEGVVTATNADGTDTQAFSINITADVIRIFPADGMTLTSTNAGDWPNFTFSHVDGIEWYRMWFRDSANNVEFDKWFPAVATATDIGERTPICDTETNICTIPDVFYLPNDNYQWWINTWSPTQSGANWTRGDFAVQFAAQSGTINVTSPTGTGGAPTAATWDHDPETLYYRLWMGVPGAVAADNIFFGWVESRDICESGVCTLNTSEFTFAPENYVIWFEKWSPSGYLKWANITPRPAIRFTVQ